MSRHLQRHYGYGHLHFVTFSCYQRRQLLGTPRRRDLVLRALESTRRSYRFIVVGYVVMPEHVHLLVDEPRRRDLSAALQALKQSVSRRVLARLRRRQRGASPQPGSPRWKQQEMFPDAGLPHFWQRRFYDFNVFSDRKMIEKLRYMHRNPVQRGLVERPEQWRWSSYRHYAFGEQGVVRVNEDFGLTGRKEILVPTRAKPARVGHPQLRGGRR